MKKILQIMSLFFILSVSKVLADTSGSIDWNAEKAEVLAAGYSEKEFEVMRKIPYLPAEKDVSKFYDDSASYQNKTVKNLSLQERVVEEAKKQLGKPYGKATPPNEFTCDRLVKWAYKQGANIELPNVTTNQEKCGTEVPLNQLQVGDLLFWGNRGVTEHVAIYIGNNQYIHAPYHGQNVQINTISPYYMPSFARRILPTIPKKVPNANGQKAGEQFIFRLYNPNAGQHHYTGVVYEAQSVQNAGWSYEGVAWVSPASGANVYRLYNKNSGEHFYTASSYEKDSLVKAGWRYENISWHSGGNVPVYRLFNPKAKGNEESHHYTLNTYERENLIKNGWKADGTVWYALRAVKP
ncbi:NlpC/P60 family protein [Lactococcus lactis]